MTVDEAKGLFALMGWAWEPLPLSSCNAVRGRLPLETLGRYEVFVNEIMVECRRQEQKVLRNPSLYTEYERYDLDACLTRYAELFTEHVANGRPHEALPQRPRA